MHFLVDLSPVLNALVATYDDERARGTLNAWGNSFPAEELPFGGQMTVDSIPFRLPKRRTGGCDSVEPLGQEIIVPLVEATGIALLCCGEMGDQYVTVQLHGPSVAPFEVVARAKGAMVAAGSLIGDDGFAFSHLHYPGDYDLAMMGAAIWCAKCRWLKALPVTLLTFGSNPLFHVLALTLLRESGHDD